MSDKILKVEQISFENDENFKIQCPRNIINIEISTKNIYIFSIIDKSIVKREVDLPNCYKKFEAYHSILNYNNKLYISGSFSSSKIIYEYDYDLNEFKKLSDMIYGHSYHTLIGVRNYIYAVSGFKVKKTERYCLDDNKWSSLPEVNYNRSWPSCLNFHDKMIYVCGGLNDPNTKAINIIERINLSTLSIWECLEVNTNLELSYNFGLLNIGENIIFLGGLFSKNEEPTDKCFILNLNDLSIQMCDFKLPNNEEFDGREFIMLDENANNYGQFSSQNFEKFYIYDKEKNIVNIIEYK